MVYSMDSSFVQGSANHHLWTKPITLHSFYNKVFCNITRHPLTCCPGFFVLQRPRPNLHLFLCLTPKVRLQMKNHKHCIWMQSTGIMDSFWTTEISRGVVLANQQSDTDPLSPLQKRNPTTTSTQRWKRTLWSPPAPLLVMSSSTCPSKCTMLLCVSWLSKAAHHLGEEKGKHSPLPVCTWSSSILSADSFLLEVFLLLVFYGF
ncbi:uncharacterized protein [Symphalangus syndactylus]|uniref:uncharacterized protein isoform X2 n=1 Tax=Symphalangus syndactylus TaxID=9590 RepID=UPI0030046AAD